MLQGLSSKALLKADCLRLYYKFSVMGNGEFAKREWGMENTYFFDSCK